MGPVAGDRSRARLSRGDRADRRGSPVRCAPHPGGSRPGAAPAPGPVPDVRVRQRSIRISRSPRSRRRSARPSGTLAGRPSSATSSASSASSCSPVAWAASPRLGLALAAMAAWWSGGFYVTWQDFTEPILIGFLVLGAAELAAPTSRWLSGGILLGLAAATKQFGLGLLPFLPLQTRSGRRALAAAIVTWLVAVVPFALWHAPEFAEGAFLSHIREPGRVYALNLLNWPGMHLEVPLLDRVPVGARFRPRLPTSPGRTDRGLAGGLRGLPAAGLRPEQDRVRQLLRDPDDPDPAADPHRGRQEIGGDPPPGQTGASRRSRSTEGSAEPGAPGDRRADVVDEHQPTPSGGCLPDRLLIGHLFGTYIATSPNRSASVHAQPSDLATAFINRPSTSLR